MNKPIYIALLGLTVLIGFYTAALAQNVPVPAPRPVLQPAAPPSTPTPQHQASYVAPIPFGGLYNVLSDQQPPAPGVPRPLTPFNTQPLP